jgi:hypothetical protein
VVTAVAKHHFTFMHKKLDQEFSLITTINYQNQRCSHFFTDAIAVEEQNLFWPQPKTINTYDDGEILQYCWQN